MRRMVMVHGIIFRENPIFPKIEKKILFEISNLVFYTEGEKKNQHREQ